MGEIFVVSRKSERSLLFVLYGGVPLLSVFCVWRKDAGWF